MLPGKTYTPEDIVAAARRRVWFVVLPFVLIAFGTMIVAHFLPNRYRSDSLLLVIPQRVPEAYVQPTVTTKIEDRLQALRQQILSRSRLEPIITELNLYERERRDGIMEDVIERMRRDVGLEVIRGDAFRISYMGNDPRNVLRVAERLTTLAIDENVNERSQLAENTNKFLETQLVTARQQLIEQEKKLEEYRKRYTGELPSQATANLQAIHNLQLQIQSVTESLNRYRDRRLTVQSQLTDLVNNETTVFAGEGGAASRPLTARERLAAAQQQLKAAEARFTPEHPDLRAAQRRIAELEREVEAEALSAPLSPEASPPANPAQFARQARIRELKLELASLDRNIESNQNAEKQLRQTMATYQARVESVPARETELAELTRDYATLQTVYSDLLAKHQSAQVAANLERRQIGEQFKLLDPPRLPERPISPDRLFINLMGALGGLAFGIGLAAFLEYRDSSFRTEEEVTSLLGLPVLARIPNMITAMDRQRAFRRRMAVSAAACLFLVGAGTVVWRLGVLNELFW